MLMREMLEPYSCRYCGVPARGHGKRWNEIAGIHSWRAPYRWQVLDRMKARRDKAEGKAWRWQR